MRTLYIEDLASHGGPESCVGDPRGRSEALTGVRAGSAIEPRNQGFRGADVVKRGGRQHRWSRYREWPADPEGNASGGTPSMNDDGKSDSPVLPAKLPNNPGRPGAEVVEGRGLPEGNAASKTRPERRAGQGAPSALDRVRRIAQTDKNARFTALLHHVDGDRLRAAYWALRPKSAPGVDGVTWHDYGQDLEGNLRDLHQRVHRGSYRAKPVRRAYIPKRDGRLRPLGVAALEDKILQRAVVEVLSSMYETDFVGFSYGFRPGRNSMTRWMRSRPESSARRWAGCLTRTSATTCAATATLRSAEQQRRDHRVPDPGNQALVPRAPAPQPALTPGLGTHEPPRVSMATARPRDAPLPRSALRRQNPREEPSALAVHAGIYAGGGRASTVKARPYRDPKPAICVAFVTRPEGFEPPTFGSVDRRSIQLSYGRKAADSSFRRPRARARCRQACQSGRL